MDNQSKTARAEEKLLLPRHIAIIMDGNGRWAKKRGLPRAAGHAEGANAFRRVALYCKKLGIEYLTVYAFSTENWKRPKEEVDAIMRLLEKHLQEVLDRLEKDRMRVRFFGDITVLSPRLQALCAACEERSKIYPAGQVNICLNYGGGMRSSGLRSAGRLTAAPNSQRKNSVPISGARVCRTPIYSFGRAARCAYQIIFCGNLHTRNLFSRIPFGPTSAKRKSTGRLGSIPEETDGLGI